MILYSFVLFCMVLYSFVCSGSVYFAAIVVWRLSGSKIVAFGISTHVKFVSHATDLKRVFYVATVSFENGF